MAEYKKIENYIAILPCRCAQRPTDPENSSAPPKVHPTLYEFLNSTSNLKMNLLDIKRRKKILHNIVSLKDWMSKEVDFDQIKGHEIVKELNKIARSFRQMAIDVKN